MLLSFLINQTFAFLQLVWPLDYLVGKKYYQIVVDTHTHTQRGRFRCYQKNSSSIVLLNEFAIKWLFEFICMPIIVLPNSHYANDRQIAEGEQR